MNIETIEKLLDSKNIDDVKLGIIHYCHNHTCEEIKKFFSCRNHNIENVPDCYPEHQLKHFNISVFIGYKEIMYIDTIFEILDKDELF